MGQTDANYYQTHKDDPGEWGEPKPRAKPKTRRLAAMVSVRFTPEEEELLRAAATKRNESLSGFVRRAALVACTGIQAAGAGLSTLSAQSSTSGFGGSIDFPGGRLTLVARPREAGGATVQSTR
jgi:hypothetical protein